MYILLNQFNQDHQNLIKPTLKNRDGREEKRFERALKITNFTQAKVHLGQAEQHQMERHNIIQ